MAVLLLLMRQVTLKRRRARALKTSSSKKRAIPEVDLTTLKKDGRILVITSCTKEKVGYNENTKALAKDMYKGRLFKAVKDFCNAKQLDYVIISAKYGLLFPEEKTEGYEKILKTKKDIEEIRPKVEVRLKKVLDKYDKVILMMGANYIRVLERIIDDRFFHVRSRGYGDLCSKIRKATDFSTTMKICDFLTEK
ncbi:hypothetical protein KAU55_00315 [Candidatus Bathyarchaeota archaeon]|nr:hypothetical protein [Candidatus Bathyarchaeota archaeon]